MQIITLVLLAQLASGQPLEGIVRALPPTPVQPGQLIREPRAASPENPRAVSGKTENVVSDAEDSDSSEETEKQSAEMEELRALEEVALDPSAKPNADLLQAIRRLGITNPIRSRMEDAYAEGETREEFPSVELPLITDLSSFDISQVKDRYDIPMAMQPLVTQYIHFFQGPGRKWFRRWMSRSTRYIPAMGPILASKGLPKDTVYLAMIESGFSPQALSWARAAGPWQFIPSTGKMYGLRQDFWVDERRDPNKSTAAAARYLRQLYKELGGDWYLAWAAYNAGGRKVQRVMNRKGTSDFWELSDGRGLAKETKHYVPKLIACALIAKHSKAFGFSDEEFDYLSPIETEEVQLRDAVDLEVVARAAESTVQEIRELNPELKRWCTPPASEKQPYILRLPKGRGAHFTENFQRLGPQVRLAFRFHRVKRGETLSRIAASYHSAPEAILRLNGLRQAKLLRVNSELVIPMPRSPDKTDASLERQVASARRAGFVAVRSEEEIPAGTARKAVATGSIKTETVDGKTRLTYGVAAGDTLWSISQRFDCSVNELRQWNHLPKGTKGLQASAALVIWPKVKIGMPLSAQAPASPGLGAMTPVPAPAQATQLLPAETSAAQQTWNTPTEQASAPLLAMTSKTPKSNAAETTPTKTVHRLSAGETLWSVARRYGVSIEDIKRWNGIKSPLAVRAGQQLMVLPAK
jgi:membrane-bound lytic murein transglycosylase D